MTQGSIVGCLVRFTVPVFIGLLFQQLYNTVDAWVVGNFVNDEAFAAVGSVSQLLNTLVGLCNGFSVGTGIVVAQCFGARKDDKVHEAVHTAAALGLTSGVVLAVVGVLLTPALLHLSRTPEDVFPESYKYLTVCFAGAGVTLLYNMEAGILRAAGDSRRPFYALVAATGVNIGLDLLFVVVFRWGVTGAALATVAAQVVAMSMLLVRLLRTDESIRYTPRETRFYPGMTRRIVLLAIPVSLQDGITSFSNVFVQGYINQFGKNVMGGWTAMGKCDQLAGNPYTAMGAAVSTFVGQNVGAGNFERVKKGVRIGAGIATAATAAMAALTWIFAGDIVSFFNRTPEVVAYGTLFLHWFMPFFVPIAATSILVGAIRGAGDSRTPTFLALGSFVVFRQIYLFIMSHYVSNTPLWIAMGYPLGWLLYAVVGAIVYHKKDLTRMKIA